MDARTARGRQHEDILYRKITFASFDIGCITWMDVRLRARLGRNFVTSS